MKQHLAINPRLIETQTPNRPSLVGDNQKNQVANNWLISNDPKHWDDFYDAKGSAQKVQIDKLIIILLWTWIFLGVLNSSPGVLLNFDALIPFQKGHLFSKNIQVYGSGQFNQEKKDQVEVKYVQGCTLQMIMDNLLNQFPYTDLG